MTFFRFVRPFFEARFSFSYVIDISLIILEFSVNDQFGYQCPNSRHPHFYRKNTYMNLQYSIWRVNALTRAFLISTRDPSGLRNASSPCVNALTRAFLISTLPLWNRLFKPLSGLVSARIFQNILKNSQYRGQKWAEGKLYFSGYNFTRNPITLL